MVKCIHTFENKIINRIFYIFLQVLIIFIFLTIFFFTYVNDTEKDAFKTQINILVDDLALDMDIKPLVPKENKDIVTILLSGVLDFSKKNSRKSTEKEDANIKKQNNKIMKKAFIWLFVFIGIMVLIYGALRLSGQCIMFHSHIREALLIVVFIALTEFVFLNMITKQYWSIDISDVRQKLGNTIQDYITKRNK